MKCPNCGNEIREEAKFCTECGTAIIAEATAPEPALPAEEPVIEEPQTAPVEAATPEPEIEPIAEPVEQPTEQPAPAPEQSVGAAEPAQEKPAAQPVVTVTATDSRNLLTTGQYFFLTILFRIPFIGLIFLFIWSLGRPRNLSLKRFALATLLFQLVCAVVCLAHPGGTERRSDQQL